jgi:trigger factor
MKHFALRAACLACAGALALSLFGCGSSASTSSGSEASSGSADSSEAAAASVASFGAAADFDYENFDYSQDITLDGYWEGITALDYVTLPEDFASITVAKEDVEPSDADVQEQLDALLSSAATTQEVTDRAAEDGDTVNIDYAGSVDGVAFTGGTATGYDLELGSNTFVTGFEDQIIGHEIGETFDITVTFPSWYNDVTDSAGNTVVLADQDVVFTITLNSISASVTPELTDEWVADYLGESDGIYTVQELTDYFYNYLYTQNLSNAVYTYLMANCTFNDVPQVALNYQVCECLNYYYTAAQSYGVSLDELLQSYVGYESADDMLAYLEDTILAYCQESVMYQAVAEKLGLVCTDEMYSVYADYVDTYGEAYLRMYALVDGVMDALCDGAQVV